MIRINLLAGERRTVKAASRGFQIGQKVTVVGSLLLVIAALLITWRYLAIVGDEAQLARDIEAARREEARLAEVLKQVADFEAQRNLVQQRVALIDELRRGQAAPVHIVDQVSRALPDMMWLTNLKQDGFDVSMEGRCLSLTSLSDFVGNLEASRYFKRPVEIIESSVMEARQDAPQLIRFVIKGTFQMAGLENIAPAKPGGRGGN